MQIVNGIGEMFEAAETASTVDFRPGMNKAYLEKLRSEDIQVSVLLPFTTLMINMISMILKPYPTTRMHSRQLNRIIVGTYPRKKLRVECNRRIDWRILRLKYKA